MKEFNSIPLEDEEAQFLEEISLLTKEPIKSLPFPGDFYKALKSPEKRFITFWYENNHIIGLNFRNSDLKKIPESIGNLFHLRFLRLERCYFIKSFPSSFENLINLELLIFYNEPDLEIPIISIDFPDIFKKLHKLKKFQIYGLYNFYLTPSFTELKNLEELDLEGCFISSNRAKFMINYGITDPYHIEHPVFELPDDIGKLKSLKKLRLYRLELEKLPKSIKNLTSLTELDLSYCEKIKNIEIIFDISSLEDLNFFNCSIKLLPNNIGKLKKLKQLNLSHNKLRDIPFNIKNCHQLKKINLYSNHFEKELECLKEISSLKHLIWNKHYPKIIPEELYDKKDLKIELI